MSKLLIQSGTPDAAGCVLNITPQSAGWQHIGFQVHRLMSEQVVRGGTASGRPAWWCSREAPTSSIDGERFDGMGGRGSVFDDAAPGAVYAPAGSKYSVTAKGDVELAVCSAPGKPGAFAARDCRGRDEPRSARQGHEYAVREKHSAANQGGRQLAAGGSHYARWQLVELSAA